MVAATPVEAGAILDALGGVSEEFRVGHVGIYSGSLGGSRVLVSVSGIGKTNAAVASSLLASRFGVGHLVSVGIAGAYPGSGLEPGEVALATSETYADEGCLSQHGWLDMEDMGSPLVEVDGMRFYSSFPTVVPPWTSLPSGPFLTLSTVTGTWEVSERLVRRFPGALCESMEGAAVAHVAALFGIPCTEVRGVSNMVGPRHREAWLVDEAAYNAQRVALELLDRYFDE